MSEAEELTTVRLFVKVPSSCQTTQDHWQDTTHYRSFDVPIPMELAELLGRRWPATIVAAEWLGAKADE